VPEIIEVELYRRAALACVGRRVSSVSAPDEWFLKGCTADEVRGALLGEVIVAARRRGKLLLLDLGSEGRPGGAVLGLRFGMTGRLLVDGEAAIAELQHGSNRPDPSFVRFGLGFEGGGVMTLSDPRRLGGVSLDPDDTALGPDAFTLTRTELRGALAGSSAPLKARLMDQSRVAGIGNLLADEILWRARLSPWREAGGLSPALARRLHDAVVTVVPELAERGGSHTGDLMDARRPGGVCPRCGTALRRDTVGGRTTWWCPREQR
jgi:formamidopyrimidine-DNA glycosylase